MKVLLLQLMLRNALVALAFMAIFSGLFFLPDAYTPPGLICLAGFLAAFLWANRPLFSEGRPLAAVLLSVLLVPALGYPAMACAALLRRAVLESRYQAEGYRMLEGCNGGAANQADFEVDAFERLLPEFKDTPNVDTNLVQEVQRGYVLAQEKARVLSDDCRFRGHRSTRPWKTNWAEIKHILAAAEAASQR
jgi:hypothetical protein